MLPEATDYKFDSKWIKHRINSKMTGWANSFAKEIAEAGLTATQMRRIFNQIKKIQVAGLSKQWELVYMVSPELTYAVQRASKNEAVGLKKFAEKVQEMLSVIFYQLDQDLDGQDNLKSTLSEHYFNRFVRILEAIVAYHKKHYKNQSKHKKND